MKRVIPLILFLVLVTSLVSADIIFTSQPLPTYNFGETITVPVTVKTLKDTSGSLELNLICNGQEINFYKNGISLSTGQEKKLDASVVLTQDMIGQLKGNCLIKASLGSEYATTQDFSLSNKITINQKIKTPTILPGENFVIEGNAIKESGKTVSGLIETKIFSGVITANTTPVLEKLDTINKGFFQINSSTFPNMAAGEYKISIRAYEMDLSGQTTNEGTAQTTFTVLQVPQNIEIAIDNKDVEPGTSLKAKAILHDQTGQNIPTNTTILIQDSKDKLVEKLEVATGEFFEYEIPKDHAPEELKIVASTENLENTQTFNVAKKEDIEVKIVNKTLILTNTGNVPYCNKSILIKIAGSPLNINPCLEVGKEQKYVLTAPEGEYEIEILSEGKDTVKQKAVLTGGAIGIEEASQSVASLSRYPLVWIFVIIIMGFVAYTVYKKGMKRSFIGYIHKRKTPLSPNEEPKNIIPTRKGSLIKSGNKAELSLSIKGEKQNSVVLTLKIKNLKALESARGNSSETLQKVVSAAEQRKALTYENYDDLFFIFAPAKTRTFKNENPAINVAQKIQEILKHHNKLFKQRIEYGISINYGTIVGKQEPESFKFMSMGTLITISKKLASHSHEEILLSEKFKEHLPSNIKVKKHEANGTPYYSITEVRGKNEEHQKFIKRFVEGLEKGK